MVAVTQTALRPHVSFGRHVCNATPDGARARLKNWRYTRPRAPGRAHDDAALGRLVDVVAVYSQ